MEGEGGSRARGDEWTGGWRSRVDGGGSGREGEPERDEGERAEMARDCNARYNRSALFVMDWGPGRKRLEPRADLPSVASFNAHLS